MRTASVIARYLAGVAGQFMGALYRAQTHSGVVFRERVFDDLPLLAAHIGVCRPLNIHDLTSRRASSWLRRPNRLQRPKGKTNVSYRLLLLIRYRPSQEICSSRLGPSRA
jgi:hypothetical protein